jgi:hypothetical protein
MGFKSLSLPGSTFTKVLFGLCSGIFILFSIKLIEMIGMGYELDGFFRDVGPIYIGSLCIGYLCFSYRIVISREQDLVTVWRQFLHPRIQFAKKDFLLETLRADQVTHSGGEDGSSTTYTTLYSGTQVVVKYTGRKKKMRHVLPELLTEKTESLNEEDTKIEPFWTNPPI